MIAIDGKTSRRSHARSKGREPLHLVSAWATRQRLVLGQGCFQRAKEKGRGNPCKNSHDNADLSNNSLLIRGVSSPLSGGKATYRSVQIPWNQAYINFTVSFWIGAL